MPPTAPPLEQMWPLINNLDWADDSFSREKAYVCAVFSECAYWCIPRWELDRDGRVKLVPCDAYQELVRSAEATGAIIGEALRKQDFPQPIIIARRYAVAVILPIRPVIIVAIRGTKYLYDWLINLNVAKVTANFSDPTCRFHRGFARALGACFPELAYRLREYASADTPVYVTGHSLGGAMAAVMHATNGRWRLHETWQGTHSAYTFGMPRYGNFSAVVKCPSPYHIYVDADIVPTVPPRWLGFEECGSEYRTDGVGLERAAARETLTFSSWLLRLASGVGVREHSMELYRARVAPTFKTSLPY